MLNSLEVCGCQFRGREGSVAAPSPHRSLRQYPATMNATDSPSNRVNLRFLSLSVWLLLIPLGHCSHEPATSPKTQAIGATGHWRIPANCGINSLYLLLRLHGIDLSYEDLTRRLRPTQDGTSLTQLRDAASSFGFGVRVVHLTPESLQSCPLPLIAHVEMEGVANTSGHYVVVTDATLQNVELIDGTTAIMQVIPRSDFIRRWTGYALIASPRPWWQSVFSVAAIAGGASLALSAWYIYRSRRLTVPRP